MKRRSLSLMLYLALAARGGTRFVTELARSVGLRPLYDKVHPNEPRGIYEATPDPGPLIWFHTENGSVMAALAELTHAMADQRPELSFLITVADADAREVDTAIYAEGTHIVLRPNESTNATRGFLEHWKPDVGVWVGVDIRPTLIKAAVEQGVTLYSIDGPRANTLSPIWRWLPGLRRAVLAHFSRTLVGDKASYERHLKLGSPSWTLEEVGFLEEGAIALPCNENERADLAEQLANRPTWLAACVHVTEEGTVLAAHKAALRRAHRLLLILVPDQLERGQRLAEMVDELGMKAALRSEDDEIDSEVQVYIADTRDDIGLWYRLAPITFMGQSLTPEGNGRNPYEPAAFGSAVVHGPNVAYHRAPYGRLAAAGAATLVRSQVELAQAVEALQAPDRVAEIAHAAWEVTSSGAEVSDRIARLIFEALDRAEAALSPPKAES